jgi:multidrug resistance efflux pump
MEHLENTATLEKLTNDYEKVKNGLGKKIIEKSENELQLLKYRLAGKEKELGLLEFHRDDYVIKAPEAGIVSFIPSKPGGYAESGGTVARVAAVEQKKFVALVDEKQIYKVKVGQKVRIVSSLYNYLEYGYFYGKVISIRELPEKHPKGYLYPVKIVVTHEPYALKLGSSAEVSIITNLLGWNK